MSLTYKLWDSSSNSVTLVPNWDLKDQKEKIFDRSRAKTGSLFQYDHGHFRIVSMKFEFTASSVASVVNSWWENQQLCQLDISSNSVSEITSVMIINKDTPFSKFTKPYIDKFSGKLDLSTY